MFANATKVLWLVSVIVASPALVQAQPSDVVEVTNGDTINGTVSGLERGTLSFRTAAAGTLSITWGEVVHVTSTQNLDIELMTGERFVGSITSPTPKTLIVQTATGPSRPIAMADVVYITLIEEGFRGRTSGSLDFGFMFATLNNTRTYTLDGELAYHSPAHAYETDVTFNSWLSARDDVDKETRNALALELRRRLPSRWFAVGMLEGQQDDELQLDARVLAGGGIGRMLVKSSHAEFSAQGGLDYDGERYDGDDSFANSVEVFGGVDWDWFAGSSTEARVVATTYVSLERERVRLEWDASVRRNIFWSLYWAANVYDSFDSDPPSDQPRSSLGVSLTFGWSF